MPRQPTIVGNAALLVIDIQKSAFLSNDGDPGIPVMSDYSERMARARAIVDAAHDNGIPVIFVQEIHRRNMVDYGRELDGSEGIHCMEGEPGTPIAYEEMGRQPQDYYVPKRRYSCFFATDMEILLKGLKTETLIFVGGMTDVCVHYSFADGHQLDYYCRVVSDCVGGTSDAAHEASLNAMEYLQEGAVMEAADMIAAMGSAKMAAE